MTVSSEACGPISLRWTGAETSFVPGWQAQDVTDIEVYYLADAQGSLQVLLTLDTHYAATLAAGSGLVTVTPVALPAAPGYSDISPQNTSAAGYRFSKSAQLRRGDPYKAV